MTEDSKIVMSGFEEYRKNIKKEEIKEKALKVKSIKEKKKHDYTKNINKFLEHRMSMKKAKKIPRATVVIKMPAYHSYYFSQGGQRK